MQKLMLAALLALLGTTQAMAQVWGWGWGPPPPPRPAPPLWNGPPPVGGAPAGWAHRASYGWCTHKARRLYAHEAGVAGDRRPSRAEQRTISALRSDLRSKCGTGRWTPESGWHYPGRG